jgi:hypothetical protein
MTTKAIWTVTGLVWDRDTRDHTTLQSIDFERRVDATGYMNTNREWIKGMVLDRSPAAIAQDLKGWTEVTA